MSLRTLLIRARNSFSRLHKVRINRLRCYDSHSRRQLPITRNLFAVSVYSSCLLVAGSWLLSGCSGMSYKEKSLALIGAAVLTGYSLGTSNTPTGESQSTHGLLWAGVAGTVAGVSSPYLLKDDLESNSEEVDSLKNKIKILENKTPTKNGVNAFLEKPLPKEFSNLIRPGGWKIYAIDEWVKDGEERLVHQDKMLEIQLPEIKEGR